MVNSSITFAVVLVGSASSLYLYPFFKELPAYQATWCFYWFRELYRSLTNNPRYIHAILFTILLQWERVIEIVLVF